MTKKKISSTLLLTLFISIISSFNSSGMHNKKMICKKRENTATAFPTEVWGLILEYYIKPEDTKESLYRFALICKDTASIVMTKDSIAGPFFYHLKSYLQKFNAKDICHEGLKNGLQIISEKSGLKLNWNAIFDLGKEKLSLELCKNKIRTVMFLSYLICETCKNRVTFGTERASAEEFLKNEIRRKIDDDEKPGDDDDYDCSYDDDFYEKKIFENIVASKELDLVLFMLKQFVTQQIRYEKLSIIEQIDVFYPLDEKIESLLKIAETTKCYNLIVFCKENFEDVFIRANTLGRQMRKKPPIKSPELKNYLLKKLIYRKNWLGVLSVLKNHHLPRIKFFGNYDREREFICPIITSFILEAADDGCDELIHFILDNDLHFNVSPTTVRSLFYQCSDEKVIKVIQKYLKNLAGEDLKYMLEDYQTFN